MKKIKGYVVVPQVEDWAVLQPQSISHSSIKSDLCGERLASSRVLRDQLMHQIETIVMQEVELSSAFEILDSTRLKCDQQHDAIVQQLETCDQMLTMLERKAGNEVMVKRLLNEEDFRKWKQSKEMVTIILPEVLVRLEDSIELNNDKIRNARHKMERLRAKRLVLREEIAATEEDIGLMRSDVKSNKPST